VVTRCDGVKGQDMVREGGEDVVGRVAQLVSSVAGRQAGDADADFRERD
jgi:hypothetical protein